LNTALTRLLADNRITKNDMVTVLAGNFGSDNGASYVEICTAENLLKRK